MGRLIRCRGRGCGRWGRSSPRASCGTRSPSRGDRCPVKGTEGRPVPPSPRGVPSWPVAGRGDRRPCRDSASTWCRARPDRRRCAGKRGGNARRDRRARDDVREPQGSSRSPGIAAGEAAIGVVLKGPCAIRSLLSAASSQTDSSTRSTRPHADGGGKARVRVRSLTPPRSWRHSANERANVRQYFRPALRVDLSAVAPDSQRLMNGERRSGERTLAHPGGGFRLHR
jgi:hypothetical protein